MFLFNDAHNTFYLRLYGVGHNVKKPRNLKIWQKIELSVNSVNAEVVKTVPEIKKKWQDIKTSTKSKEGKRRKEMGKTGGGKAEFDSLNAVEEMAVGVVGETAIEGIDEDLDSYDNDQTHNERKNDNGNSSNDEHTQDTQTRNTHHEENINLYIDIEEPHNDPPSTSTTDQELSIPCKVETKKSRNASYNMEESNKTFIGIERKRLAVEEKRLAVE